MARGVANPEIVGPMNKRELKLLEQFMEWFSLLLYGSHLTSKTCLLNDPSTYFLVLLFKKMFYEATMVQNDFFLKLSLK